MYSQSCTAEVGSSATLRGRCSVWLVESFCLRQVSVQVQALSSEDTQMYNGPIGVGDLACSVNSIAARELYILVTPKSCLGTCKISRCLLLPSFSGLPLCSCSCGSQISCEWLS